MAVLSRTLRATILFAAIPLAILIACCIGAACWIEDFLEGPPESK